MSDDKMLDVEDIQSKSRDIDEKTDKPERLIEIENLSISFFMEEGTVCAVNELYLYLKPGQTMGIVGETGAGKTTTALGIMSLIPSPPGLVTSGKILFEGENLLDKTEAEMRKVRGSQISMIFQDPMTSLNPTIPIREQIAEVILLHENINASQALIRAEEMLEKVGIRKERSKEYPHQFSGGMRQRVGIAIALACNPKLLIADEPTTALDVTIQAQVLELMKDLKKDLNTSMIMITHDLGIVAEICDMVSIMYAGSVIEMADKHELFTNPKHPYTIGLFNSLPDIESDISKLTPIEGLMPDPINLPTGCPFHPRCTQATPECSKTRPNRRRVKDGHYVKCLQFKEV